MEYGVFVGVICLVFSLIGCGYLISNSIGFLLNLISLVASSVYVKAAKELLKEERKEIMVPFKF